jgi:hypothetical protein
MSEKLDYVKEFYKGRGKIFVLKFNKIYAYTLLLRSYLTVKNCARVRDNASLLAAGAW